MNDETLINSKKQAFGSNLLALFCAAWFLLTGWMWTFLMNVVISFPFAVLGFILWARGRKLAPDSLLNRWAFGLLIAGAVASVGALFMFK